MPCRTWKIPRKILTFWIFHLLSIWDQDGSEIIVHIPWPSMEWACASLEWLKSLKILELESMLCGLEQVWGFKNENPQIYSIDIHILKINFILFTAIMTAAMEMLGGGAGVADQCRTTDIMSDAAYVMLTR